MSKTTTIIAAVIVVAIVVGAGAIVIVSNDDKGGSDAPIASKLQIRGNANDDATIDANDMAIVNDILDGKKSLEDYPLADYNGDGKVDQEDKRQLQDLIDRKEGTTVYVLCLDTSGNPTTVLCTYPLRNIVTYATNMQLPVLYANGGQYIAGYFNTSYKVAESSISDTAEDLKGDSRKITDETWKNFTELDGKLSGGVGALLADSSGVSQFTESRVSDLEAAGIPLIIYSSADTNAEIETVLTVGFLLGSDCENKSYDYAQKSWNVIDQINNKVKSLSDADRKNYISCTMYICICQNDSTFNSSPATAGGIPYYTINDEFKTKYAGTSSIKMTTTEALSNYTDIDCIINNRSIDFGLDADGVKKEITSTWDHNNKGGAVSSEYFKGFEDKLVYVNNILPGAVKVAYMAHALYSDMFTLEWANNILKEFIDMGYGPLADQTLDTIVSYIDVNTYNIAKA